MEVAMNDIIVYIDDTPVRFTDDGEVFVIDAIGAVTDAFYGGEDPESAEMLWRELIRRQPELYAYCRVIAIDGTGPMPVADSDGWEKIHETLFELLIALSQQGGLGSFHQTLLNGIGGQGRGIMDLELLHDV
jgi:hypothetical protein